MPKKKVLIICGESEVPIIHKYAENIQEYVVETETSERIMRMGTRKYLMEKIELLEANPNLYDGIIGTRDMTCVFANVIAEKGGKPGTSVESMINCHNKYISRKIQKKYVPQSTPGFWLDSEFLKAFPMEPPFFLKPVVGNMGYGSQKVNSYRRIREVIKNWTQELAGHNRFYLDALEISSHLSHLENLETCNKFMCEELIDGTQVTVMGFVHEGEVKLQGMAKAVFCNEGISFSHHEYPYKFSDRLNQRIEDVVKRLVMSHGLNNTFFNIEMRVDEEQEKVYTIEVNCRTAFQFVRMLEAVTGVNHVKSLCDIAVGKCPEEQREDVETFNYSFNFELREFENRRVMRTPMLTDLEKVKMYYPEVTVKNMVTTDTMLSDYKQNPESFRYCILDVPGQSHEEIMEKYEHVRSLLGYEFKSA